MPSPLTEANSASLDEYFSRKPPYDAQTLAAIKAEFRRLRAQFVSNGGTGKTPKAKKASTTASKSTDLDIFSQSPESTPDVAS